MNIVDQQHIHIAEFVAEIVNRAESQLALLQSLYKLIGKILSPYVFDFFIGKIFLYFILYGKHKMGLSDSRGTVNNKRVVGICGIGRYGI